MFLNFVDEAFLSPYLLTNLTPVFSFSLSFSLIPLVHCSFRVPELSADDDSRSIRSKLELQPSASTERAFVKKNLNIESAPRQKLAVARNNTRGADVPPRKHAALHLADNCSPSRQWCAESVDAWFLPIMMQQCHRLTRTIYCKDAKRPRVKPTVVREKHLKTYILYNLTFCQRAKFILLALLKQIMLQKKKEF